jgi:arylsulfatase A-like enzyme
MTGNRAALLHLTLALIGLLPVTAAAAATPNVLMIVGDDQGWTDFGFMGHPHIRTPHLDKLASQGHVFTRGYVPTSLCRPSLASIITGLYPHQHKQTGNDPPKGADRSQMLSQVDAWPTLPRLLQPLGYQSLQTGKWWEGNYRLGGFTHGMTHGDPARRGRHGDEGLKIGREGLAPVFDFIRDCGERPFLIWYAPMLPHTPHNPPQRLLERYQSLAPSPSVARYWAMCEWFDETCGQLLDHLDERGLTKNTLVLFVTDNGWIQGPSSAQFAPKSKRSPYDGGLRTPVVLRWPAKIRPRRDETTLVSSIDLAPTVLAACGLRPREELAGMNLLEIAAGKTAPERALFGATFTHDAVKLDEPAANLLYRWCVDGKMKLILPRDAAPSELYDVTADPHETRNLAQQRPEVVVRLADKIEAWWPAK